MFQLFSTRTSATGTLVFAGLSTYFLFKKLVSYSKAHKIERERANRLVIITGCDTGLGYSMAVWACKLGYKVIASCLNESGEGAQKLKKQFHNQIIIAGLNVTDETNLENFHSFCREVLQANEGNLKLWAVVANAAVCTMGEFFWQTEQQLANQMNVNFWGTVNLISELRTLLFESKSRVIIISSDCSEYPLPFLSAYCASKAALNAWTQSFRFEVAKYGISVAAYQPRGFANSSGLFSNIELHYSEMVLKMSNFERNFYGEYFDKFMKQKQEVFESTRKKPVKPLSTYHHQSSFVHLLENDIRGISVHRDFSSIEIMFHTLYKNLPQAIVDWLVLKVLNPASISWKEKETSVSENVASS